MIVVLGAAPAAAQTRIGWWTIDGGGGRSAGGVFAVQGTLGQPDAGRAIGGGYTISGGFWTYGAAVLDVPDLLPGSRPLVFRLLPPSPNPVRGRTVLRFDLPVAAETRLRIFDVGGRLVRTLVAETLPAGAHEQVWDGKDDDGRAVPTGIHFARLSAGAAHATRKLMVLR